MNNESHYFDYIVDIRNSTINQLVGVFTHAETDMLAKYGGVCDLKLDEYINGLIQQLNEDKKY